jgi:hypothetical protein
VLGVLSSKWGCFASGSLMHLWLYRISQCLFTFHSIPSHPISSHDTNCPDSHSSTPCHPTQQEGAQLCLHAKPTKRPVYAPCTILRRADHIQPLPLIGHIHRIYLRIRLVLASDEVSTISPSTREWRCGGPAGSVRLRVEGRDGVVSRGLGTWASGGGAVAMLYARWGRWRWMGRCEDGVARLG